MARTLTTKQAAYRDARVSGLGPADAYRSAYDASRMSPAAVYAEANKLENHPQIAPSITQSLSEAVAVVEGRRQEAVASAAWIIAQSVELVERCMQAVPVRDAKGEPTGEYEFDSGGANRALDRLAKMYPAVFAPDSSGGDTGAKHLHLHGLSESELRAIASGFRA